MKLTSSDYKESAKLAQLAKKVDNLNAGYVNALSDEIFQRQPFFLTVLLGHRHDLTPEEFEEVMKIYFLTWEYFKAYGKLPAKKVTEPDFEKIQSRLIEMLKHADGESNQKVNSNMYANYFEKVESKSLLAAVLFRYHNRPVLMKMKEESKGIIFIGIKCFIECFENINKKTQTHNRPDGQ